jgi:hypothetical protein
MLGVVAAVQTGLWGLPLRPVIVGGSAVEIWTDAYATVDIDVLLPSTAEIEARLDALGFVRTKDRRHWEIPGHPVLFEMPGAELSVQDMAVSVAAPVGEAVLVLRCEDILVHRLEEFVATGHADAAKQAHTLIQRPDLDRARLYERARISHVQDAVDAFFELAERAQPGTFERTWDLHDLQRELEKSRARRSILEANDVQDAEQEGS